MTTSDSSRADLTLAFASPLLRFKAPDATALNAALVSEAMEIRSKSPGVQKSNRQGWHSETDLMTRTEPGLSRLASFIERAMHAATKAISGDFNPAQYRLVANGWININPQHGYNVPHSHSGYMWSGCYYVTVPPVQEGPSGCIEFLSPVLVPGEYKVLGADCYKDKITMRPKAGDLLLFPSYMTHWVYPNEADEDRITIAFNGTYLPK